VSLDSSDALQGFADFIAVKMGLSFPRERHPELAQKMATLAKDAGYDDLTAYLLLLMSPPLSKERMKLLAGALTVGETYFLRDPKSYRVFEEELLPAVISARRGKDKTIRIWSAGCSSGEEPYSLAILLNRALPDLADWKVTILASDINAQALERARRGIYSKWSFRNAPPWLMEYFTREPDGKYGIVPRIREMVRFVQLNLADPAGGGSALTTGMDFIFCRNVMLYFHAAQIEKSIARFHNSLNQEGWLFVGPTEVNHQSVPGFTCQHYDGALVLKKSAESRKPQRLTRQPPRTPQTTAASAALPLPAATPAPTARPVRGRPETAPPSPPERPQALPAGDSRGCLERARALYQAGRYEQAALEALCAPDSEQQPENLALAARAWANIGRYAEARESCERALALDRLSAQNHYLFSIILDHLGDADGAVSSLRRALYIDHDFLIAYFALGSLCRQRGEQREAEQSFANAMRLLRRRDPHEVLPEADGMTAGRLLQLVEEITGQGGARG